MTTLQDSIICKYCETGRDTTTLYHVFCHWTGDTLLVAGVIFLIFALICWKWRLVKKAHFALLKWSALVTFILGASVYTVGALQTDGVSIWDAIYTVPSAIISSLGMFFYQDDISELAEEVKEDSFFMAMYSLAHFFAALITSLVLIRLIGMRLFYWIEMTFKSYWGKKKDLYVFWGINPQAITLAESIKNKEGQNNRIVFVNTVETENIENEVSIHTMFDIIKIREDANERISNINAMVVNCHKKLRCSEQENDIYKSITEKVGLSSLARMMKNKSDNIHIFFLSNNSDNNINSMEALVNVNLSENKKLHLYCHARHSAKTRWAEIKNICTYSDLSKPRIHIVDSSYLSVFNLKENVAHHPINFVDIDKETGTVVSSFRSMIIGFGETGEEAFKFLYEFGAFVNKDGKKSNFHCTIIDKKASELEGLFYAKAPSMKECTDNEKKEQELLFTECSINSKAYWEIIEKEVRNELNYIIISIDNEELAIDTATNICTLATRWRKNPSTKLSVYVRSYNADSYDRLVSIANVLNDKIGGVRLEIFGCMNDIFSYDSIVENQYIKQAKCFNYAYYCVSQGKGAIKNEDAERKSWEELHKLKRSKELYEHSNSLGQDIWNIEEVERKRDQNISNALHAATKWRILTKYVDETPEKGKAYWQQKILSREKLVVDGETVWTPYYIIGGDDVSSLSPKDAKVLINVARLEHERWIAASRLQGQSFSKNKSIRYKQHTDIVSWDDLRPNNDIERKRVQGYDCAVVDTTIQLNTRNNQEHND